MDTGTGIHFFLKSKSLKKKNLCSHIVQTPDYRGRPIMGSRDIILSVVDNILKLHMILSL